LTIIYLKHLNEYLRHHLDRQVKTKLEGVPLRTTMEATRTMKRHNIVEEVLHLHHKRYPTLSGVVKKASHKRIHH